MNDTTPPGNHGDIWHEVGECGYCEARRDRAANAYFDEHPDAFSEMILRAGPAPTINDLFLTAADKTDRHTELHHLLNRAIDGVVLHGESDRLRELVRELEQRAERAGADLDRVQQAACRTAEELRKAKRAVDLLAGSHRRAEQGEAAIATFASIFEGFGRLLATSSRDWQPYRVDAWLWAVVCGWDCEQAEHDDTCIHGAMEETAALHGWDADTVAKARRYRATVRAALDEQQPTA
ncbi:hypothetical protein [Streptomyces sp900116325]|uniref:hypothetical protein n=1 Tax=Streptomyces sp. 900116325 TaxID=3154295 RepID=UPI0033218D01